MAMLERTDTEKMITKVFVGVTLLAVLIYVVIMVSAASALSGSAAPSFYEGRIGPINLFKLSVVEDGGQTSASVAIAAGTLIYLAIWAALGVIFIWWRKGIRKAPKKDPD